MSRLDEGSWWEELKAQNAAAMRLITPPKPVEPLIMVELDASTRPRQDTVKAIATALRRLRPQAIELGMD